MTKSSLKWAGSKQPIIDQITSVINQFEFSCLVEPFFGAGNVSLNVESPNYLCSDYNEDLVNYHNTVIKHPYELLIIASELFERTDEKSYYELRAEFNSGELDVIEKSAVFLYLNKYGFNGLCRYNRKGEFNSPWCRSEKVKTIPEKEILMFSSIFEGTEILHQDFQDTILQAPEESVIYCDPPYVPLDGSQNVGMYKGSFGFKEHEQLKKLCKESPHPAIISNHWTEYTKELYSDASEIIVLDVRRSISRNGTGRIPVQEVIAIYE